MRWNAKRGDPPGHGLAQNRLTIQLDEALCSQETRPHQASPMRSSGTTASVLVGSGMTLAVPGAKGFVALAQRAVIRSGSSCRLSDIPIAKPLGFVPRAGGRRRNLHGTFPRMPHAVFTGTRASKGENARLTSSEVGHSVRSR